MDVKEQMLSALICAGEMVATHNVQGGKARSWELERVWLDQAAAALAAAGMWIELERWTRAAEELRAQNEWAASDGIRAMCELLKEMKDRPE